MTTHEYGPARELGPSDTYAVVRAALERRDNAEAAAWREFMEVMDDLDDAELVAMAAQLRDREVAGIDLLVVRGLILEEHVLARLLATRHFGSNPPRAAVDSLAEYFHYLWIGETTVEREPLSVALETARRSVERSRADVAWRAKHVLAAFGDGQDHP